MACCHMSSERAEDDKHIKVMRRPYDEWYQANKRLINQMLKAVKSSRIGIL